jgi:hypothetical protein
MLVYIENIPKTTHIKILDTKGNRKEERERERERERRQKHHKTSSSSKKRSSDIGTLL